jgi:hypothetical protein
VLLRDSRGLEAESLGEWLESVVMPALSGPGHHRKGPKTPDPILSGLKALTGLQAAQVARDRHSNALEKAVHRGEDAMNALTALAGKKSVHDLMAWWRGQANVPPVSASGTTTASSSEEVMNPLIGEGSKASPSGSSLRPLDVIDGNSDQGLYEADVVPLKVRPAMIPLGEAPAVPVKFGLVGRGDLGLSVVLAAVGEPCQAPAEEPLGDAVHLGLRAEPALDDHGWG